MSESEIQIDPLNDLIFKKTLASESQKPILQGFINDFFGIDAALDDITIITPYSIKNYLEFLDGKDGGVETNPDGSPKTIRIMRETLRDITVVVKEADLLIELQIYNDKYFIVRAVYYLCDRFCANYNISGKMTKDGRGKYSRYSSLRSVYALNIVKRKYFRQDEDALHIFSLFDKKHELRLNKEYITLGFFELLKTKTDSVNQEHWRKFFLENEVAADAPVYIKQAKELIDYVNLNEEERKVISEYEKAEASYESIMYTAYEDGLEEGKIKKGLQIAINCVINWHFSVSDAMKVAELDSRYREDVLEELREKGVNFAE